MKKSGHRRAESLGEFVSLERIAQGVHVAATNGWLRVEFWASGILRVRAGRQGESVNDFSYALDPDGRPEPMTPLIQVSAEQIELHFEDVTAQITKHPLRIRVLGEDGGVVLADDPAFGITWMGQEVTVYKELMPGERFLGLGEKTGPLDKRGRAYVNANTDHFGYGPDSDPLYASIPFFIGVHDQGVYGFFLNNSYKTTFNFGASSDRFTWYAAEDGQMDYFYFHGGKSNPVERILRGYASLTGHMLMPPKWALGFQQCRYSYYPDAEVLRIGQTFREKRIPCDVLYLDIHYMEAFKVFTWNNTSFPDPQRLVADLKALGIRLVVILDPGIKVEEGYESYDTGLKEGHFAMLPDGKPYSGQVWPGWSHFPDFTSAAGREWWGNQMHIYTEAGVEGFWNDMNEPAAWGQHLPGLIEFAMEGELGSFKEARNIYGMQMARATVEGATKLLGGKRPFNLTRAGFAGIQRYAAVWTGDNTASEEHMFAGVRLVNSLGLSGVAFAGYDIGGFVGEPSPALYARWMQLGAFSPFFRAHSMINTRDAEPWSFGEEVEDIARNFIRLRYRLLPYLYSAFEEACHGLPLARSLALEWPQDPKIYQQPYDAAYLFGPEILVVPVPSNVQLSKVYLPQGQWFEFYDDALCEGGKEQTVEVSMEKLPLFVRAGAVIPMQSAVMHTEDSHSGVLSFHVYAGEAKRSFRLYEDDGLAKTATHTPAFCIRQGIHDSGDRRLILEAQEGSGQSEYNSLRFYFHGAGSLALVQVNKEVIPTRHEDFRVVDPISRFDPFLPAFGKGPVVQNLPFIEVAYSGNIRLEVNY